MIAYEPVGNWILVEPDKMGQTRGGLTLPEAAQRSVWTGLCTVKEVGPGAVLMDGTLVPMPCKAGDRILVNGSLTQPDPHGVPIYLIEADRVIAVVRGEPEYN